MSFLPILVGGGITAAQQLEQTAEQAYSFQSQSALDWQSLTFDTAMNQQAEHFWTEASLHIAVLERLLKGPDSDELPRPGHRKGPVPDDDPNLNTATGITAKRR